MDRDNWEDADSDWAGEPEPLAVTPRASDEPGEGDIVPLAVFDATGVLDLGAL